LSKQINKSEDFNVLRFSIDKMRESRIENLTENNITTSKKQQQKQQQQQQQEQQLNVGKCSWKLRMGMGKCWNC